MKTRVCSPDVNTTTGWNLLAFVAVVFSCWAKLFRERSHINPPSSPNRKALGNQRAICLRTDVGHRGGASLGLHTALSLLSFLLSGPSTTSIVYQSQPR